MKFGLSIKFVAALSLILMAGCSPQSKKASSHQASSSQMASNTSSKTSKPQKQSRLATQQGQIKTALKACVTNASGKTAGYVKQIGDHQPVEFSGNRRQRSASVIKIFVMIEAFRQIKAGTIHLSDNISIPQSDKVGGTGVLANQNTQHLTCGQLLNLMIKNSDNTATNVLIDKLGGLGPINQSIKKLGCSNTSLQRKMLDYSALQSGRDNYTSASDVGKTLNMIYTHRLLGSGWDTKMLNLLQGNANQTKIPAQIRNTATIYNKTGEFPDYGVQNDAAIIQKGNRAFIAVILSENGTQSSQINAMSYLGKHLYQIIFE
ncbi:serine hydrolase [Lentilactobacillus otakiensis]|uniref:serine hydrolase n=1 Tax=Lentilactobacillus otakiensis TaxID=481720 RepID=UPI003D16D988